MMTRRLEAPEARAASTNSFSLIESMSPRTTRAIVCQNRIDRTPIISVVGLGRMWTRGRRLPARPFWAMASTAS